jgi:hypothetical protein
VRRDGLSGRENKRLSPSGPCRVGEFRRLPKFALKRPGDGMHGALADLAGLAPRLELDGDLLQELRPALVVDRLGQAP